MLGPSLESGDFEMLTGQLVLLARSSDVVGSDLRPGLSQDQLCGGLPNPYKTNVTGTFLDAKVFGEVVAGRIDCPFPVLAIIKLPCGDATRPSLEGKKISAKGELQLHVAQVVPETKVPEVSIQKPKRAYQTPLGDLVLYTEMDIAFCGI